MKKSLQELRHEIDQVDDSLHDLIMRRVELVEQIGAVKLSEDGKLSLAVRPIREAEIMRRVWNRHKGAMDKDVLIRLWRELISACVNLQTQMTVAVYMPERGMGNLEIAREYFGTYTQMIPCRSVNLVLKELTQGEANLAVLSLQDDQSNWWYALAHEINRNAVIFAKLPVTVSAANRGDGRSVFALGNVPYESSGQDRTLLVVETDGSISLSTVDLILKACGIPTNAIYDTYAPDMMRKAYLFEVDDYVARDDPRLNAVFEKEGEKITFMRVIGGFPVPLD